MKSICRASASAAVALAFAAATALAAFAQAQPQEGAPAVQQEKAPKTQAPKAKAPARAAAKKSNPEVMALQAALKKAGEDPGPADGVMGRKTRTALRAFQKKNGLKTTGQADKDTMAKLQPFMSK